MFDEVARRGRGEGASRRARFVLGASALQLTLVVAIVALPPSRGRKSSEPERVAVKFLKALPPRPSPLPPRASPPPRPPPPPRARSQRPRAEPAMAPPQPLTSPREIAPPPTSTDPDPPEPERDAGSNEGVVGGVAGSGGPAASGGAPEVTGGDDAPVDASAGFRTPRMAEPGCVQRAIRVPDAWMERLGVVTVRFAVDRDGTPNRFQPVTHGFADRVTPEIWRAVQSCRWLPGADAAGRSTAIWVVLPIRFTVE